MEGYSRFPNYLIEVNDALVRLNVNEEVEVYRDSENLAETHLHNRWARLLYLPALQKAVSCVLENYISQDELGLVLEVGSGTGIFEELLAPVWLRDRLISFDINRPSLNVAQEKSDIDVFQGNSYQLGVASESVDALITLNGMDSNLALWEALREGERCLKKGGKLIVMQSLTPALFENIGIGRGELEDFKNYFDYLLRGVSCLSEFELVENGMVEAVEVENRKKIKKRLEEFNEMFGIFVPFSEQLNINDIGLITSVGPEFRIINKNGEINGGRRLSFKKVLEKIDEEYVPYRQLSKVRKRRSEVIEWIRMGYLVAEKNYQTNA